MWLHTVVCIYSFFLVLYWKDITDQSVDMSLDKYLYIIYLLVLEIKVVGSFEDAFWKQCRYMGEYCCVKTYMHVPIICFRNDIIEYDRNIVIFKITVCDYLENLFASYAAWPPWGSYLRFFMLRVNEEKVYYYLFNFFFLYLLL